MYDNEHRVIIRVLCDDCGQELFYQNYNVDCDRAITVDAPVCEHCKSEAYRDGREAGYDDGYDTGYEEGKEYSIEYEREVDDAD